MELSSIYIWLEKIRIQFMAIFSGHVNLLRGLAQCTWGNRLNYILIIGNIFSRLDADSK